MVTKLSKVLRLSGILTVQSGLHIGAGNEAVEIGGTDAPVVKSPLTGLPYIPGSSLKGRMRWLLERARGEYEVEEKDGKTKGKPSSDERKITARVFGAGEVRATKSPTRLVVRDCELVPEDAEGFKNGAWELEFKMETAIDRITGKALDGTLRNAERIPAGVRFSYHLSLLVFEGDNEQEMRELIAEGLRLIESTYLGGRGSRGYGAVTFDNKERWEVVWPKPKAEEA